MPVIPDKDVLRPRQQAQSPSVILPKALGRKPGADRRPPCELHDRQHQREAVVDPVVQFTHQQGLPLLRRVLFRAIAHDFDETLFLGWDGYHQ